MPNFLSRYSKTSIFYPAVLSLICLYLIMVNHVPGTWLSGWDTLHPEFNFGLNFQRLIFGVFRDNQGLGAVAAHAHMSDLPRVIFIYLLSFIFSPSILRYIFISLTLPIGSLGVYFFLRNIIFTQEHKFREPGSFLGALFYILNLGTLQQFYVPFEMFNVQYAFLPWLFLYATNYIKHPGKKNLLIFAIITLLATPMAYAPTLWYAYFLAFGLYLIFFLKSNLRKCLILVSITLAINSFWVLPNIYFLASGNASNVPKAKINELFSQEAFAYNKSFGNLQNALIFKNFLFEWNAYQDTKVQFLMSNWNIYLSNNLILRIGYLMAGIYLLGLVYAVIKKNRYLIYLTAPSLLAFIFLINENPPFDFIFLFLREHSSFFKEALRFPFTKFSLILIFTTSCYFAFGCNLLYKSLSKLSHKFALSSIVSVITVLLIIYMYPAFKGDFISKLMQIKIPNDYFQTFDYFNKQPMDGRVAMLPIHSFWGWILYNWGYQGSGFISYGIKQPLLDRDFDRWNPNNEEYYREMSYAIYARDINLVENVLNKYQAKYILLDNSVISPGVEIGKGVLFTNETKSLLEQSNKISLVKSFGNINIYQFNLQNPSNELIYSPKKFIQVIGPEGFKDIDFEYQKFGDYIKGSNQANVKLLISPFNSLMDNQNFLKPDLVSFQANQMIIHTKNLPTQANISLTDYLNTENSIPAKLWTKSDKSNHIFKITLDPPQVSQTDNNFTFNLPNKNEERLVISTEDNQIFLLNNIQSLNYNPQADIYLTTKAANNFSFYSEFTNLPISENVFDQPIDICGDVGPNQSFSLTDVTNSSFGLTSKNTQVCLKIPVNLILKADDIKYKTLIHIKFKTSTDNPAGGQYCLFDNNTGRCIKSSDSIKNGIVVDDYFNISTDQLDTLDLIFYNTNYTNQVNKVLYQDVQFQISNPQSQYTINPNNLQEVLKKSNLNLNKNSEVKISLTGYKNPINLLEYHKPQSCSNILPIEYDRTIDSLIGYVEYSSIKGSSCDFYSLPNLAHNQSYLLLINNQNISGMPLRICINNSTTQRCDVYSSLGENKTFATQALVIPPANDGGSGFSINIDNASIGTNKTINRIKDMQLIPFPYNWLSQMVFSDSKNYPTSQTIINKITKHNDNYYSIDYSNPTTSPSLLVLGKTFDKGWVAFGKNHVLVNSWANGWIINPEDEGTLNLVYIPQLLEFLGFLIVLITLSSISIRKTNK